MSLSVIPAVAVAADKPEEKSVVIPENALVVIVTDPLAAPLSCPCVKGYAQRDYDKFGKHLEAKLDRPVAVVYSETLAGALTKTGNGRAHLIVGKDSVLRAAAPASKVSITHLAALAGKDGKTTQTGLICVAAADKALTPADLRGYTIYFGTADAEEKNGAAVRVLKDFGLELPAKLETCVACTDGATKVIDEAKRGKKVATVISSYAQPLLEGCGTIKKSDLRVIGETDPVPFVAAFATGSLSPGDRDAVRTAILDVGKNKDLCAALETKGGFIEAPAKKRNGNPDWTQWRGPNRDGRLVWLPDKLPAKSDPVWEVTLTAPGLGGVAATSEYVLVSDRELNDTVDVWRCLKAADGKEAWAHRAPALGNLDYGNSPRATPLIHDGCAYLLGAFGDLACVELATGKVKWSLNVRDEFDATDERKWGVCDSPLLTGGKLIVAPGGKNAALVALDPKIGKTVWKAPGKPSGYGSFVAAKLGGTLQIIGHDSDSLGGWDAKTGKRLWTLRPERRGDFNVPTPTVLGDKLLVTTENNGTRLFAFNADGTIDPKPVAINKRLAPDTHTPVVAGDRVFGVWHRLYCLDLKNGLEVLYDESNTAFSEYCSAIATDRRVLLVSKTGELILVDADANEYTGLGRLPVFGKNEKGVHAHPALVGTRVYVRGSGSVVCLDLG